MTPPSRSCSPALFLALAAWLVFLAPGCEKEKPKPPLQPVKVTVALARRGEAALTVTGIGHVEPKLSVNIRSQVTGTLMKTHFAEGARVKEGDLLFNIDPAPFEAKLRQAQAAYGRDKSKAEQAQRDFARYQELIKKEVVSEDDYEKYRTTAEQSREQVRQDEAEVVSARLNLGYCQIRSPLAGVAGYQKIKDGNLVNANTEVLVTINQIEPVSVRFSVSEGDLPMVRKYMGSESLPAAALLPGLEDDPEQGRLTVINNTVDPQTGMILLQADFENKRGRLWPGQFANVVVTLVTEQDVLTVPSRAVMTRQDGSFVFVVTGNGTVALKGVKTRRVVGADTVIQDGLAPGEKVVLDGLIRLFPGAPVKLDEPVPPGAEAPGPGKGGA